MDSSLIEKIELNDLPYPMRHWKSLQGYRGDVDFLPYLMKEKVCEQLMACDYMLSLEQWLKPISIIAKRHKRIYVQQIASIYEGMIDVYLDKYLGDLTHDSVIKEIVNKRYTEYRSFSTSLKLLPLVKEDLPNNWMSYLEKIAEVRNYIHLSKQERADVNVWLNENSSEDIRKKLNEFISYAKNNLKT